MTTPNRKLGLSLNLASVVVMSFSPLLNKFALQHINPSMAAVLNSIFAAALCYLYSRITRISIPSLWKNRSLWLIGLTNAVGVVCLFLSLELLSPVMIGVLGRFYIVFAILLSALFLKEPLSRSEIALIVTAVIGMFLFVNKGIHFENWAGTFLALLYTLLFALTNTLVKMNVQDIEANSILFYNNAISMVFIIGYIFITGCIDYHEINAVGSVYVFLSALLSGFIGLLLFYNGLKYIKFSTANLIRSTSPIWVAIIAWPFFPADLTLVNIIGAIILIGSIVILTSKTRQ
jgi:drug/metabolite transporter (DMT)-like permease